MESPPTETRHCNDAVVLAAQHVKDEGLHEKKVLLVISDGEDNQSKHKLKEVVTALQESKIIVYTVGLLRSDSDSIFADEAKKALKQMAEAGGGASFFPKNSNDVEEVCRRIARELRHQYTIGYRPSNEKLDGAWRKVIVRVNPPKTITKISVHTKKGFYAPVAYETQVASQQRVEL